MFEKNGPRKKKSNKNRIFEPQRGKQIWQKSAFLCVLFDKEANTWKAEEEAEKQNESGEDGGGGQGESGGGVGWAGGTARERVPRRRGVRLTHRCADSADSADALRGGRGLDGLRAGATVLTGARVAHEAQWPHCAPAYILGKSHKDASGGRVSLRRRRNKQVGLVEVPTPSCSPGGGTSRLRN